MAFIPLSLLEWRQWKMPSTYSLAIILYLGVFCSVLAFLLYIYGLKRLDSGSAVNLLNLVPVLGVGIAFLFLHESVTLLQIVGGIVAVFGVILGAQSQKQSSMGTEGFSKQNTF